MEEGGGGKIETMKLIFCFEVISFSEGKKERRKEIAEEIYNFWISIQKERGKDGLLGKKGRGRGRRGREERGERREERGERRGRGKKEERILE
jgi:hypothetical protein